MKYLLVIVLLFSLAFCTVEVVNAKRGLVHEAVALEVEVNGPCKDYASIVNSIQISSFTSVNCLPISLNSTHPNPDVNDKQAHVYCLNLDGGRSLFRFVEIFVNEDDEITPAESYIVSWISPIPFAERTRTYSYMRRPSCSVQDDVCSDTQIVKGCTPNLVTIKDSFVQNTDRVYFIPPSATVVPCYLNGACCPYVSNTLKGICGGTQNPCQSDACFDRHTDNSGNCISTATALNNGCVTDSCNTRLCNAKTSSCEVTPTALNNGCVSDACNNRVCNPVNSTCDSTPTPVAAACVSDACSTNTCNLQTGKCDSKPTTLATSCVSDACKTRTCVAASSSCVAVDSALATSCTSDACYTRSCDVSSSSCISQPTALNTGCVSDACNTRNCSVATSSCVSTPTTVGASCVSDGCYQRTCNATTGSCTVGTFFCDDNNVCTKDICQNSTGTCIHIGSCYDGKACTYDQCIALTASKYTCSYTNFCSQNDPTMCYYCTEQLALCENGKTPTGSIYDINSYCPIDIQYENNQSGQGAFIVTTSGYCTSQPLPSSGTCPLASTISANTISNKKKITN